MNGERLFILMDTNDHIMKSSLIVKLAEDGTQLEEFSHNFWGEKTQTHTQMSEIQ